MLESYKRTFGTLSTQSIFRTNIKQNLLLLTVCLAVVLDNLWKYFQDFKVFFPSCMKKSEGRRRSMLTVLQSHPSHNDFFVKK